MPRGQNMKVKRLNRRKKLPLLNPTPALPVPEKTSGAGRPAGSYGLRKSLELQFCSSNPSPVQESIIAALIKLDNLQKSSTLSPRDLIATFSSQKSLIKLLQDLSGKTSPSNGFSSNSYDSMSLEELESLEDEFGALLASPHKHLADGTTQDFPMGTPGFKGHVLESVGAPLPRRGRLNDN